MPMQLPDLQGKLPPNARVETHPNGCYDWGTIGDLAFHLSIGCQRLSIKSVMPPVDMLQASCIIMPSTLVCPAQTCQMPKQPPLHHIAAGWLLEAGKADTSKYKYFIFMNSSVRGPFIPPYARVGSSRSARRACPREHV
jgi:hypothetical protein